MLHFTREEFYQWLSENHNKSHEVYVAVLRQNPAEVYAGKLSYIDAVEVALCFGWIDSVLRNIDGITYQRFSPRRKDSNWTELNKERVRRLIRRGEMTDAGLVVCPGLNIPYSAPQDIIEKLKQNKKAYEFFMSTPVLYQRIRLDNIVLTLQRTKDIAKYKSTIERFIKYCRQKKMYGQWNDYGRLL